MARNKSNASLKDLVSGVESVVPRLDTPPLLKPVLVSVGVQTDLPTFADKPVFTISGAGRKDSLPESESSTDACPSAPRQLDACLSILKSDVSP